MELYINGDAMAFDIIYDRYKDLVYTYLRKRLSNEELVHDVFQNIFIKFHRFKEKYKPQYSLSQWIFTISRNEWLDHLKKAKKNPLSHQGASSYLENIKSTEEKEPQINIDLSTEKNLSDNEKRALQMRYITDSDFEDISKVLKTTPSNARKLISRGLKKLRVKYIGGSHE